MTATTEPATTTHDDDPGISTAPDSTGSRHRRRRPGAAGPVAEAPFEAGRRHAAADVVGDVVRLGLPWSRLERMGSLIPSPLPTAGSSQASPSRPSRGSSCPRGRSSRMSLSAAKPCATPGGMNRCPGRRPVEIDHLGRPVGPRPTAQVVQDDADLAAQDGTSSRTGGGGSAGRPPPRPASPSGCPGPSRGRWEPAAPVGLDERPRSSPWTSGRTSTTSSIRRRDQFCHRRNGSPVPSSGGEAAEARPVEQQRAPSPISMATTWPVTSSWSPPRRCRRAGTRSRPATLDHAATP